MTPSEEQPELLNKARRMQSFRTSIQGTVRRGMVLVMLAGTSIAILSALASFPGNLAHASGKDRNKSGYFHLTSDRDELDDLNRAVRSGKILSLAEVKRIISKRFGKQIIDIEIDRDHGRWIYEVKVVQSNGRLVEVELDGQSGTILDVDND